MSNQTTDRIADRVIVLTGAANGFGKLVAEQAAERGASVVGLDINEEALETVFAPLAAQGYKVAWKKADVSILEDMQAGAALAIEKFGRIDVMINNAGIMPLAFFSDHEKAAGAWDRAIDINIKGVVHGISAVYEQMIKQGRGHVINVSSTYGNSPTEGSAVYGATKSAVNMISDSLRMETQGKIKVSVVRPTGVAATGLVKSIINFKAVIGILGQHNDASQEKMKMMMSGTLPEELASPESVGYFSLAPEYISDAILYVIDQPWGVLISDITVRASGEATLF